MAQFIADICAMNGVPRKACLRLTLLVEELFTNTVVHGHGADSEAPVYLAIALQPGSVSRWSQPSPIASSTYTSPARTASRS